MTSTVVSRVYPVKSSFDSDIAQMAAVLAVVETPRAVAVRIAENKVDCRHVLAGAKFLALGTGMSRASEAADLASDPWFLTDSDDLGDIEGAYR